MSRLRNLAVLAALLSVTGQALAQGERRLPDLGSPADSILNQSREAQLGRSVMQQMRNAGAVMEDPLLTEYVGLLGSRLASQANNSGEFDFAFFLVEDSRINAFALPGGYVGVNTGLIAASDNESEVAGVLAHEVAHVTQRHIARSIYDSQRTSLVSMATMIAAVLLGAATDISGDGMQGLITAGQAAAIQRQINFTRANEHEADRVGIELLADAGFDPNGMAAFFEKLSRRYGMQGQNVPEILRTHPVTTSRIAEARARASQMASVDAESSLGYELAKARIAVLAAATPEAALASFELRQDQEGQGQRYGRALALSTLGRNDEAERLFGELVGESPGVVAFRIGRAEALMGSGLVEQAMAAYEEALKLSPRNRPLTVSYGDSLIRAGRPDEAHSLLLDLYNIVPPTPSEIQLIARAANAAGLTAHAHYYMAEYHIATGSLTPAISQIQMALESPDLDAVDRARYEARLERFREYLAQRED